MRKILYILGHLSDQDIEWMADSGRVRDLADGDILIREAVETTDIFIVLNGVAEVVVGNAGTIAVLRSGEVVGEMAFVDHAPPSASVRAAGPLQCLAIEKRKLQDRLDHDPGFGYRFFKALAAFLSGRLRDANILIANGGRYEAGSDRADENQLDDSVLDQVSMAGVKFHHMLETLQGAARR